MNLTDKLKRLAEKKAAYFERQTAWMDAETKALQRELLDLIFSDYIGKFQTDEAGKLLMNTKNTALISDLDRVFEKFNKDFQQLFLKDFGTRLVGTTVLTAEYYKGIGIEKSTIDNILSKTKAIDKLVGINIGKDVKNSTIIKGSYLDNLGQTAGVREEMKKYIINSIGGGKDMKSYMKGFKDMVVGSKDTDGRLQRYYKQYAYDTFSEVEATADNYIADNLRLNYFVYQGGLVGDSRPFCIKHNGKVYSRKDAEKFDKEQWKGKKPDVPFLIQRGGYNCRHFLNWISDEQAEKMGKQK